MAAAYGVGRGLILVHITRSRKQDRFHAEGLGALDVVLIPVAHMEHIRDLHVELLGGTFEHAAMRLGVADFIGESKAAEVVIQIVQRKPPFQTAPRGNDRIRHDGEFIAFGQFVEGERYAIDGVGRDGDFHFLVRLDHGPEFILREGSGKALQEHAESLIYGPCDVLFVPNMVEGGVGHIIRASNRVVLDWFEPIERTPDEVPSFILLGTESLGRPLRLVRVVMYDGVPQVKRYCFDHGRDSLMLNRAGELKTIPVRQQACARETQASA